MSKGSNRRPRQVSAKEEAERWELLQGGWAEFGFEPPGTNQIESRKFFGKWYWRPLQRNQRERT